MLVILYTFQINAERSSYYSLNSENSIRSKNPKQTAPPTSNFSSQGVVDRVLSLSLKSRELSSIQEITAEISSPITLTNGYQYKWKLGEGVQLISGSLDGESNETIPANDTISIQIKVSGYTKYINHHIGFEIYSLNNSRKLYADGLMASQKDNSFEKMVQRLEKSGVHKK